MRFGDSIDRRSFAEQVFDHIKRKIISGEYEGGERISEEKIANDLGVSRTPIREAIRKLSDFGLVIIKPRSYAEVISLDKDDIFKISMVRAELEGLAASLITDGINQEDYRILEYITQECEKLLLENDVASVFEMDSRFHLEIALLSKNEYIYETLERLDSKIQLCRVKSCVTAEKISSNIKQHYYIIEALREGQNKKAQVLLKDHILGSANVIASELEYIKQAK